MLIKDFPSAKPSQQTIFLVLLCSLFVKSSSTVSLAVPVKKQHAAVITHDSPAARAYLNNLRQSLLKNWELIDGKNKVVLECIVNLDGTMSELRSTSASETSPLAIESAMNDVEKCKPLPPIPSCYKHSCKLTLTFNSTVDPHGDSNSDLETEMTEIQDSPSPKQ